MGHNIKLTGKRYQTSLGREFKPVYDEAKDMNSLVFATVVKVNYRFNTVDVVTTKNADSLVKPTATRGKLSARLPVTFGGSLSNGKPYGDFIPITEGDTVLIGFVDGLKDNPIVVNIYKDNATASNIAPFRAISGDPESGDLIQGALAYSKVYPYQTMEYTAGNGDHTHTFPGRTAFAVRSTTPTLQYTDITDEYNINPGVLPNGLPIDPTNTEKPQMFLTHRGTYDRDIINALWDTDSSFTMSRFNADLPEKSSFRIVNEKTILFQYNLDNLDNTKAKTAEIGIKDGVPTLSFGGHTLTMGKDGAEIDGISIALTIQQLVESYTEEFAEMKETVDYFIAQIDGFDIQTYKEMQATLQRLAEVVIPDLRKQLNKLSGEYHEFVNTTYPQFIAGYVQFREAQLELNKGFEKVARDVSDGHGTFSSLNDRFVAEETTTKAFREAQTIKNTGYTNTSKEVVDARGTYSTLKDRLDSATLPNPNEINVKDYGAVGSGLVNESASIQKAIDAGSALGVPVYFPNGVYYMHTRATFKSNLHIILSDGATITRKTPKGIPVAGKQGGMFSAPNGKGYGNTKNVTIEGGKLEGDLANNIGVGMSVMHVDNFTLRGVTITEAVYSSHVADLMGSRNALIENCTISGANPPVGRNFVEAIQMDYATYAGSGGGYSTDSYDGLPTLNVTVQNCTFKPDYNADGTIKYPAPTPFGSHGQIEGYSLSNAKFINNTVIDAIPIPPTETPFDAGIIHSRGIAPFQITGNTFINTTGVLTRAIAIRRTPYVGSKNAIAGPESESTKVATAPVQGIVISNNTFHGFTAKDGRVNSLILVAGTQDPDVGYLPVKGVTIHGNTFSDSFTDSNKGKATEQELIAIICAEDFTVTGNTATDCRRLLYTSQVKNGVISSNVTTRGNYIAYSLLDSKAVVVSGNVFTECAGSIRIDATCEDVSVTGNVITKPVKFPGVTWSDEPIYVHPSATNVVQANNIVR